jgi:hypothetical protein
MHDDETITVAPVQRETRRGRTMLLVIAATIAALLLVAWAGLQIEPAPFARYSGASAPPARVPMPRGLPAPVDRFYRTIYPDGIPVITSAIVSGRATLRIIGIPFPARFRFTHDAGKGYRHYIEATWFGLPVMKVDEHYLDGKGRLDLPFGVIENSPKVDQGANLGMWAESVWLPGIFLTDPRVRWEPVDSSSAILAVPYGNETERFLVRFDPDGTLLMLMESMRFKGADSEHKTLWVNRSIEWKEIDGYLIMATGSAIWMDDGIPWATFRVDDVVYNVDVADYIRAKGE